MLRRSVLPAALLMPLMACGLLDKPETCCTVDGVVKMCEQGVTTDVVVSAIQASGVVIEPTADQIIALHKACQDGAVIDAFRGGAPTTTAEEDGAPGEEAQVDGGGEPTAQAKPEEPKIPWLSVSVSQGSRGIEVTNSSSQPYTNVVLTANGEYVYRLPVALRPGDGDYIRLASFVNRNGVKLDKSVGVRSLYLRADQGEFSMRF